MKYLIVFFTSMVLISLSLDQVSADDKLKITGTLSSFAALAQEIGGDLIETSYVAPPKFNPHFIEPRPSDVLKLKRTSLFLHSGLDLEAWREPLVDASARADLRKNGAAQLDLSAGISLLEVPTNQPSRAEGDIHLFGNPHFWIDPRNGLIMARTIAAKLSEIDPKNAPKYQANLDNFSARLNSEMVKWRDALKPFAGKELVGYHNEWIYLMEFAGLKMSQFLEPKPGIPPSPRQIEFLQDYIKTHGVKGIVQATFYPTEASGELAQRTGAKVLSLCQNVGEVSQADNYFNLIDYNVAQLVAGLK